MNNRLYVFLHIPKTAGTTLRYLLERKFPISESFYVYPGHFHTFDELKALSGRKKDKLRFISGHFPSGQVEAVFPGREIKYLACFRDPLKRKISHYKHFVREFRQLHPGKAIPPYSEFAEKHVNEASNSQVRRVLGSKGGFRKEVLDSSDLERALNRIDNDFVFAGLSEKFDESLCLLSHAMEWTSTPFYIRENVSPDKDVEITEADIAHLREQEAVDIRFYEALQERFARAYNELACEEAVAEYKRKNAEYGKSRINWLRWKLRNRYFTMAQIYL